MRPKTLFATIVLLAMCSATSAQTAPAVKSLRLSDTLCIKPLGDGVYVVTDNDPVSSNSMVLAMSNSEVVLLDTPWTPSATELLLRWINKRFGAANITAINTHYHPDRLGGNAALIARGIPVYGSDHTAKLLTEKWEPMRKTLIEKTPDPRMKDWYRNAHLVPPDHIFPEKDGLVLRFGAETVEVSYPGPGHTPDNLIAYYPSKKALFGGCAIIGWEKLGNMLEADAKSWLAITEKLALYDARIVVPGHGGDAAGFSPKLIENTRRLLSEPVGP